jgi:hypothetical protein
VKNRLKVTFAPMVSKASRSSKERKHRKRFKRPSTTQSAPSPAKRRRRQSPERAKRKSGTKPDPRQPVARKDVASATTVSERLGTVEAVVPAQSLVSSQVKNALNEPRGRIVSTSVQPSNINRAFYSPNDVRTRRCSTGSIVTLQTNKKQGRRPLSLPCGSKLNPINVEESVNPPGSRPMAHGKVNLQRSQRGIAAAEQRDQLGNSTSGRGSKRQAVASQQRAWPTTSHVSGPTAELPVLDLTRGRPRICADCGRETTVKTKEFNECLCIPVEKAVQATGCELEAFQISTALRNIGSMHSRSCNSSLRRVCPPALAICALQNALPRLENKQKRKSKK